MIYLVFRKLTPIFSSLYAYRAYYANVPKRLQVAKESRALYVTSHENEKVHFGVLDPFQKLNDELDYESCATLKKFEERIM